MSLQEPRNAIFPGRKSRVTRPRATPRTGTPEERSRCLRLKPGETLPESVYPVYPDVEMGKAAPNVDRTRDEKLGPVQGLSHTARLIMG
jgi:hypothetical protein